MKKINQTAVGCLVATVLLFGAAAPVSAAIENVGGTSHAGDASRAGENPRAAQKSPGFDSRIASANDADLLTLMLTGTGSIVRAHPELPVELGFSSTPMEVNDAGLALVINTFIEKYPAFSAKWSPAIRSGDPIRINAGLNGFMIDFIEYVETDKVFEEFRTAAKDQSLTMSAHGDLVWVWNVAVVANAAVVATTVGVAATIAAAAMAIALVGGVFIAYLDDVEGSDGSMDIKNLRRTTVIALAS